MRGRLSHVIDATGQISIHNIHKTCRDPVPSAVPLAEGGYSGREIWTRKLLLFWGRMLSAVTARFLLFHEAQATAGTGDTIGSWSCNSRRELCDGEKQFVEG